MTVLAIIILSALGLTCLPGHSFVGSRPKLNWSGSPHPYFNVVREFAGITLAIYVLVSL